MYRNLHFIWCFAPTPFVTQRRDTGYPQSCFLRADNSLIDMNFITSFTGMTDKWFYKLISEGHFPKPIKLGRSSRWYKSEVEQWK